MLFLLVFCSQHIFAQSNDANYPTPIVSNEISGIISARAVGDSRLTRYFYRFGGNQGDVFINVKTKNLNGDIDIFTSQQRDSLTKITIYADSSENETGRVIYLRKPENLILRIEARSPNDEPAAFSIKFAGSFAPSQITAEDLLIEEPKVSGESSGTVKVNSVGTILETPKPEKPSKSAIVENSVEKTENRTEEKTVNAEISETFDPTKKSSKNLEGFKLEKKPETAKSKANTVTNVESEIEIKVSPDINSENKETENKPVVEKVETAEMTDVPATENKSDISANANLPNEENKPTSGKTTEKNKEVETKNAADTESAENSFDPSRLANVRLVISLKNGKKIEHQMSEVVWFNVNQGVLTIITNGGKTEKFQILDVAKMTVE